MKNDEVYFSRQYDDPKAGSEEPDLMILRSYYLLFKTRNIRENDGILFQVMEKIHGKDCQSFQVDFLHCRKDKIGLLLAVCSG